MQLTISLCHHSCAESSQKFPPCPCNHLEGTRGCSSAARQTFLPSDDRTSPESVCCAWSDTKPAAEERMQERRFESARVSIVND